MGRAGHASGAYPLSIFACCSAAFSFIVLCISARVRLSTPCRLCWKPCFLVLLLLLAQRAASGNVLPLVVALLPPAAVCHTTVAGMLGWQRTLLPFLGTHADLPHRALIEPHPFVIWLRSDA